jgi:outer membrane biosynthesis protein TonB
VASHLTGLSIKPDAPATPAAEAGEGAAPKARPRAAAPVVAGAAREPARPQAERVVLPMPAPVRPPPPGRFTNAGPVAEARVATTNQGMATAATAEDESVVDGLVYSATDTNVKPPVLLSRSMPSRPGEDFGDAGVFDLVVDAEGRVERVGLVSPGNRFQERMLIAAAKAWKFQPATLDGRPVKYRTQVRITW